MADILTAELCNAYDAVSEALDALRRARENAPKTDERLCVTVEKIERHARGLKNRLWDLQPGWRAPVVRA